MSCSEREDEWGGDLCGKVRPEVRKDRRPSEDGVMIDFKEVSESLYLERLASSVQMLG